jgi:hypothetical protein
MKCQTVCITFEWVGSNNAWDQEKLEARKMLGNVPEANTPGARFLTNGGSLFPHFYNYI